MKIAMLMDKPIPMERVTGIGIVAYQLSQALAKRGIDITLIGRGRESTTSTENLISIHTIPDYTTQLPMKFLRAYMSNRFDLVHTHTTSTVFGVALAKIFGIPIIRHSHGSVQDLSDRLLSNMSDRIVVVSNHSKSESHKRFQDKMTVVHSGVDTELFKPRNSHGQINKKYGFKDNDRVLLSIGRVQRNKGQHFIIEAMGELVKKFDNLLYLNVGGTFHSRDIKFYENVSRIANRDFPGKVRFLWNIPHQDLSRLINRAELCIHPSLFESFGLAVVEEMSCGKPVVAFGNTAIPELIDNMRNGVLVMTGDVHGLVNSISDLLSDSALAWKLGQSARKKVLENFTWEKAASNVISVYESFM
ncbi:MAG: glycosyltransferase family 4 protein [Nitrososphaerales archaeon]